MTKYLQKGKSPSAVPQPEHDQCYTESVKQQHDVFTAGSADRETELIGGKNNNSLNNNQVR